MDINQERLIRSNLIYLDNASSTSICDDIIDEMVPFFSKQYGNPSSIHQLGRFANNAIENARKKIADLINADQHEIYITSGGTESNNAAIYGITHQNKKNHVIVSSIEHDSILQPCNELEKDGFKITYLKVDSNGIVNPRDVKQAITNKTCLVSIMFVNNEVGTIQPIYDISEICNINNVLFHTDAAQSVGKICINVKNSKINMLTISSHKINGPKGIGALYIKNGTKISPFLLGGGQENGFRSGTENVASIVGFGKACQLAKKNMLQNFIHLNSLKNNLILHIIKEIPGVILNGHDRLRVSNNAHFSFLGINGEDLLIKLDENGVAASTGSACAANKKRSSHVLKAMGLSYEEINSSLRLTVGILNTNNEIIKTVKILKKVVKELRNFSSLKYKYQF